MRLTPTDQQTIQRVKSLLDSDYPNHYTLTELAQKFHVSQTKLRKGFYHLYGITIYAYVIFLRIEKAKAMLGNTDFSVNYISAQVGYEARTLERQFKKLTGMLPLEWRKIRKRA